MAIRTLIVDDESLARRVLKLRLAAHADIEVIGEAENGRQAVAAIREHRPELMFLDVQMPGLDGFGVLRALAVDDLPLTVFVTAYDRHAIEAFDADALDYLLKPIDAARMEIALLRVRRELALRDADAHCARLVGMLGKVSGRPQLSLDDALSDASLEKRKGPGDRLSIKDSGRTIRVPLNDIQWIDAAGDYMCVHTADSTHVLRARMSDLLERLDPAHFQRVHRSTIVNLGYVRETQTHTNGELFLLLESGQRLKLSRTYKDSVRLLR